MKNLLLLTEAGKGIGFGHYTRCMAVQERLIELNINAQSVVNLKGNAFSQFQGDIANWLEEERKVIKYSSLENVLVDSYLATPAYFVFLKQYFKKVFVFDDYNRIKYGADLIINPNVFFDEVDYQNQKAVGGKDFTILRKSFRNCVNMVLKENINKVLITLGGSDFRELLPKLVRSFAFTDIPQIYVIDPEQKLPPLKDSRIHVLGRQNEQEVFKNFQDADIVISACGQTLHELASMGKATIGICLDIDQEANQSFYYEKRFLLMKNFWNDGNLADNITVNLNKLRNRQVRENINRLGRNLINVDGVSNICRELILHGK